VLDHYDFGNMKLQDVDITPDSQRLIGVGPLLRSPTGLQPSKSRVEKRLVGMCRCQAHPLSDQQNFLNQCTIWRPSKSKGKPDLLTLKYVFTMNCRSLTPVLEVVKDITIAQTSRSGLVALVSYEHDVGSHLLA